MTAKQFVMFIRRVCSLRINYNKHFARQLSAHSMHFFFQLAIGVRTDECLMNDNPKYASLSTVLIARLAQSQSGGNIIIEHQVTVQEIHNATTWRKEAKQERG